MRWIGKVGMESACGVGGRLRLSLALLLLGGVLLLATVPATAAECEGDECQGPPPAPAEVIPGTAAVEGPQNPPVRFPKSRRPRKHHVKKQHGGTHRHPQAHRGGHS